jgi:hypothetical protein
MSEKQRVSLLAILFVASFLMFFAGLGDYYLWEDEAETAVISRNILTYGLPVTYDGKNMVTQEAGYDSNAQNVWTLQTWLPHYVTALSFKLFGVSTFTARLPYAVFGFFSVVLLFFFIYRQKRTFWPAYLASFFLAFSLTFVLHSRQCRYYSLVVLLGIIWLFLFWQGLQEKRFKLWPLVLTGALFMHTQYFTAVAFFMATFAVGLFFCREQKTAYFLEMFKIILGISCLFLPWAYYVRLWEKLGEMKGDFMTRIVSWIVNIICNLINLNHFIFPLVLVSAILVLLLWEKTDGFDRFFFFSGLLFVLIISHNPLFPKIRYLIVLTPWAAYSSMLIFKMLYKRSKPVGVILLISLVFSNLWSMPVWLAVKPLAPKLQENYKDFRFDLLGFMYELTHENNGPIETFIRYREKLDKRGETIFISYGAEPLIFYTDLQIVRELPFGRKPDWIILRGEPQWHFKWLKWVLNKKGQAFKQDTSADDTYVWNYHMSKDNETVWEKRGEYIKNFLRENRYREVSLPVENSIWENGPNLLWHRFGYEQIKYPLVVYNLD